MAMTDRNAGLARLSERTRIAAWIVLLTGASVAFSLGLACATPFAAIATMAALNLRSRDALILTMAAWAANQAVGYGLLDYPTDGTSFAWGALLGLAALAAYAAARACRGIVARTGPATGSAVAFLAAFTAYEGLLLAADLGVMGHGGEAFTAPVIWWIFQVNAVALAGLLVVYRAGRAMGLLARRPHGAKAALAA